MKLYDYYRSTACYRVRIALHLKNLSYEKIPIHLVNLGGEHHLPDYLKLNPQGLVPTLTHKGKILTQSLAIIEYLDELSPAPSLLPNDPFAKAEVRSLALTIACDMHPLNNLRVLQELRLLFKATEATVNTWYHHWLKEGFDAIEKKLSTFGSNRDVCYGQHISLADLCLVPQVYNAKRFNFSMENYPLINQINEHCLNLPAFIKAAPE